jgi:hypothetical protein
MRFVIRDSTGRHFIKTESIVAAILELGGAPGVVMMGRPLEAVMWQLTGRSQMFSDRAALWKNGKLEVRLRIVGAR